MLAWCSPRARLRSPQIRPKWADRILSNDRLVELASGFLGRWRQLFLNGVTKARLGVTKSAEVALNLSMASHGDRADFGPIFTLFAQPRSKVSPKSVHKIRARASHERSTAVPRSEHADSRKGARPCHPAAHGRRVTGARDAPSPEHDRAQAPAVGTAGSQRGGVKEPSIRARRNAPDNFNRAAERRPMTGHKWRTCSIPISTVGFNSSRSPGSEYRAA